MLLAISVFYGFELRMAASAALAFINHAFDGRSTGDSPIHVPLAPAMGDRPLPEQEAADPAKSHDLFPFEQGFMDKGSEFLNGAFCHWIFFQH